MTLTVLHNLDNSNRGGIQANLLRLHAFSRHRHDFWAATGSMAPEMAAAGMRLWDGGPPADMHFDVVVGHTVGGWSNLDTAGYAHARGIPFIECMHSNAPSPTPPDVVDGFIALSEIALGINARYRRAVRIYGIVPHQVWPKNGASIGRLSRLVHEKRPAEYLMLARTFPDEHFLLGGSGPLGEQIARDATPNLELTGWVGDTAAFLSRLKLFVFPTQDECCCVSVAAAQMAGVPVICQDIPALRETTGGQAAFATDTPDFASKIADALARPEVYAELGRAGQAFAKAHFSPEITVNAWDTYLESICQT